MRVIAASAVLVAAIAIPTPAQAADKIGDSVGCVSKVEFNSMNERRAKSEVEERWEVDGLGERVTFPFIGPTTLYPRCGKVDQFPEAFYGVTYELREGRYWATGGVWS